MAHQAVGGRRQRGGEVGPRQQRTVRKQRVGRALARHAGDPRKDHRVDQHQRQRLQDRPGRAQHRLLVADLQPMHAERVQQVAIMNQPRDGAREGERRERVRADDCRRPRTLSRSSSWHATPGRRPRRCPHVVAGRGTSCLGETGSLLHANFITPTRHDPCKREAAASCQLRCPGGGRSPGSQRRHRRGGGLSVPRSRPSLPAPTPGARTRSAGNPLPRTLRTERETAPTTETGSLTDSGRASPSAITLWVIVDPGKTRKSCRCPARGRCR